MQYGFPGIAPFTIRAEIHPDLEPIRNPVLIDMLSGKIYRIGSWKPDKFGALYIFENLPLTDYPLVVCDESAVTMTTSGKE